MDLRRPPNEAGAIDRHVGDAIRMQREALGLSVEALADALFVSPQQIGRYEAGETRVAASELFAIAENLNAPMATFYAGLQGGTAGAEVRGKAPVVEMVRLMVGMSLTDQRAALDAVRNLARAASA